MYDQVIKLLEELSYNRHFFLREVRPTKPEIKAGVSSIRVLLSLHLHCLPFCSHGWQSWESVWGDCVRWLWGDCVKGTAWGDSVRGLCEVTLRGQCKGTAWRDCERWLSREGTGWGDSEGTVWSDSQVTAWRDWVRGLCEVTVWGDCMGGMCEGTVR